MPVTAPVSPTRRQFALPRSTNDKKASGQGPEASIIQDVEPSYGLRFR